MERCGGGMGLGRETRVELTSTDQVSVDGRWTRAVAVEVREVYEFGICS